MFLRKSPLGLEMFNIFVGVIWTVGLRAHSAPSSVMQPTCRREGLPPRGTLRGRLGWTSWPKLGQVQGSAPGTGHSHAQIQTGPRVDREQPWGEGIGILVGEKLDVSQQCVLAAWKASCTLGCIKRALASRERTASLWSALARAPSRVLHAGLRPPAQERRGSVGSGPEEDTKIIRALLLWREFEVTKLAQLGEQKTGENWLQSSNT